MLIDLDGKPDHVALALAMELTDAQFELLIRTRVRLNFERAHARLPGLGESHNSCRFVYEWNDKCMWQCGIGSTYRDSVTISGEVLTLTLHNALNQYELQHTNKLSLLLPPPIESRGFDSDEDQSDI